MKCIILAAGRGSRMKELTVNKPKTLLEISEGKTILDFIIESLPKEITEIIIVVNYFADDFKKDIEKKYKNYDKKVILVKKNKKDGTLGSLLAAKEHLKYEKNFLVLQGDDIHEKKEIKKIIKEVWTAAIGKTKMPKEYFSVEKDKKNYFTKIRRQTKKELVDRTWIFSGMYILDKDIFDIKKVRVFKNSDEFGIPQTLIKNNKLKKLKIFKEKSFLTANTEEEFLEMKEKIHKKYFNMNNKKTEEIYQIFLKNIVPVKKGSSKKSVKIDSREVKKGDIFFALRGEVFDGNIFAEEVLKKNPILVVLDNPEIFRKLVEKIEKDFGGESASVARARSKNLAKIILVKNSLKTLQNLAKKYRESLKIPFLAITGSNGKTTTKELINSVLSQKYDVLAPIGSFNNHTGVPLTILSIKEKHTFAIIEMGANHIGEIKTLSNITKPNFGIITNIGIAHIGEFGNLKNIIKTKKELYTEILKNKGKIFINPEDKTLEKISKNFLNIQKILYKKANILYSKDFLKIEINKKKINTKLFGDYNIYNLEVAFTVGNFFKISEEKIIKSLEKYKPENNRSQIEKTKKGNMVIWDCYNSNPVSLKLSLKSFLKKETKKEKILILGDMKELGVISKEEHIKILDIILKSNIKTFFIGSEFLKLKKKAKKDNITFYKNIDELFPILKKENFKNKIIFLKGSNSTKLFNLKNKNIL